ncbi:MFS transporter [Pseudonocardia hydrocarbonoxydans]|uniref:Major facilitator family transporter n=1 Tax=Pseudonocardia hydrocarbonoxydans TaxID=76726 RepID=A0A4Y3WHV9_9PSEU|nr:MFS transporter [Pseudonocardia hydrocarbonoxydans]GEC17740.1 major facilitator family transporter [Pseudonocardia hydrocarbonoxydans]
MHRRAVAALWTAVFVVAFGTNVPTPLLLVYRDLLGLSSDALTGAFGVYAAGLVPALLLAGPASDRFGRRRVVVPFVVLSILTSLLFLGASGSVALLFLGRFLQGAVSGVVFSVGTAWLGELVGDPARAARLTTAALGGGWAIGPLVSGLMAQWLPLPTVLPYLVHVALMLVGLALLPRVPETLAPADRRAGPWVNLGVPPGARIPFLVVVLPVAIGVFTFPSTAVTVLPLLLTPSMPQIAVAITGLVAGVTLLTGVFAQPLGKRIGYVAAGPTGLGVGAAGFGLALVGVATGAWPLLVPVALLLGVGYGLCLAAGLTMVGELAAPTARGALTGTFYACAYLGFGVPLLLSVAGGDAGFTVPLGVLAVVIAVYAALLALPAARRLVSGRVAV